MNFRIKRTFLIALGSISILGYPVLSFAQTFSSNSDISFGIIEFATSHLGQLTIGTNGGVSLTGSGLFYQGDATVGQAVITGDSGIIEIRCSASAILGAQDGGGTLTITPIEISLNSGVAAGAGNICNGTSGNVAMVIDLSVTSDPRILIGGTLNIPSQALNSSTTFTSITSGGDSISISAVFQ